MKYMKQLCIILGVTCVGELFKYFIPLPIPGSIYGLLLMLICLMTGIIKVDSVRETGEFLIEIMPLMFIPAGVGLMASWGQLSGILIPVMLITVISTFVVMVVTGKVTDYLLSKKSEKRGEQNESDHS
ncbi:MAG: CidA/LrgA family protein [Eubacteriales bacterium]|nr:CidA/LrgA family protein [Eubacteriales bacterium]